MSKLEKLKFKRMNDEELEEMQKTRPYALSLLQTQLLYDQASMLNDLVDEVINLRQDHLKTIPEGKFEPLVLSITDSITKLEPKTTESMPWITFTFYNDGDSSVYLMVNEDFVNNKAPLYKGESLVVDMGVAQIKSIVMFCAPSGTATVRIFAIK